MATTRKDTEGSVYGRLHNGFSGLNLAEDESAVGFDEFTAVTNMYRDYHGADPSTPETVPGYRLLRAFGAAVNGVFPFGEKTVVHAGTNLYLFANADRDNIGSLSPCGTGLHNGKSFGFLSDGMLYIGDGQNYWRLTYSGGFSRVTATSYIPTAYLNGEAYEQKNLLSVYAKEKYFVGDPTTYAEYSTGISYTVNPDGKGCTATGAVGNGGRISLYLPDTVVLRGKEYAVTEIGDYAFHGLPIASLRLPKGLEKIGRSAFRNCTSLTSLILPDGVTDIGEFAFAGCSAITEVYVGVSVKRVRIGAFTGCTAVEEVEYPLTMADMSAITDEVYDGDGPTSLADMVSMTGVTFTPSATAPADTCGEYVFPLGGEYVDVSEVLFDGHTLGSTATPLFPCASVNLLTPGDIAVFAETYHYPSVAAVLTGKKDGSFSLSGSIENQDEDMTVITLTGLSGVYKLSGGDDSVAGGGLYLQKNGGAIQWDTGAGVAVTVTATDTLKIGFYAPVSATYSSEHVYLPKLCESAGNGSYTAVYGHKNGKTLVTGIRVSVPNASVIMGTELTFKMKSADTADTAFAKATGYAGVSAALITECTCMTAFDGRFFFSGNPALPGAVFYTTAEESGKQSPSYFGTLNYFIPGDGAEKVKALLGCGKYLYVFNSGAFGGRISVRAGENVGDGICPRIYPAVSEMPGVTALAATVFGGIPIFVTKNGIYAVKESSVAGMSVIRISAAVDRAFGSKDESKLTVAVCDGYLWLSFGDGEVFLCDGRTEGYAFYRLSDIGSYTDDADAAEFAPSLPENAPEWLHISATPLALVAGTVTTENDISFTEIDGVKYYVTLRGERKGGTFHPATGFYPVGEHMTFGTGNGDYLVFNTDMRGADGKIPENGYSFMGHRYTSSCALISDDCDIPYMEKSTVPRSAVLKVRGPYGGLLEVLHRRGSSEPYAVTDTLTGGAFDFGRLDFDNIHFGNDDLQIVPLYGAGKRYAETQYAFRTRGFRTRFGLVGFSFRFRTGGGIKR